MKGQTSAKTTKPKSVAKTASQVGSKRNAPRDRKSNDTSNVRAARVLKATKPAARPSDKPRRRSRDTATPRPRVQKAVPAVPTGVVDQSGFHQLDQSAPFITPAEMQEQREDDAVVAIVFIALAALAFFFVIWSLASL
jgi:hypothetical protein